MFEGDVFHNIMASPSSILLIRSLLSFQMRVVIQHGSSSRCELGSQVGPGLPCVHDGLSTSLPCVLAGGALATHPRFNTLDSEKWPKKTPVSSD